MDYSRLQTQGTHIFTSSKIWLIGMTDGDVILVQKPFFFPFLTFSMFSFDGGNFYIGPRPASKNIWCKF